jgi:hypothetical protein
MPLRRRELAVKLSEARHVQRTRLLHDHVLRVPAGRSNFEGRQAVPLGPWTGGGGRPAFYSRDGAWWSSLPCDLLLGLAFPTASMTWTRCSRFPNRLVVIHNVAIDSNAILDLDIYCGIFTALVSRRTGGCILQNIVQSMKQLEIHLTRQQRLDSSTFLSSSSSFTPNTTPTSPSSPHPPISL